MIVLLFTRVVEASNEDEPNSLIFSDVIENEDIAFLYTQGYYFNNRYYLENPVPELTEMVYPLQDFQQAPVFERAEDTNVQVSASNLSAFYRCSCVEYSRIKTGWQTPPMGIARNHPRNIGYPAVGAIVITNESRAGHVAVITAIYDTYFEVIESNFIRCQISTRRIENDSKSILGFYWQQ
jgi:hypothetical protein